MRISRLVLLNACLHYCGDKDFLRIIRAKENGDGGGYQETNITEWLYSHSSLNVR